MDSAHTVRLKCPNCGQSGLAHWAHPESGRAGPRRLVALTAGFAATRGANQREPEVLCVKCDEVPPHSSAQSFAPAE